MADPEKGTDESGEATATNHDTGYLDQEPPAAHLPNDYSYDGVNRHNGNNRQYDGSPSDLEVGPGPQPIMRSQSRWPTINLRHREPLPFKERALRVSWAWFPATMSTGAMASLISQQPFTFPGLTTIGKICYIVDLVMFISFTVLIGIRFVYKPRALTSSLHHPSESFFFGAWWVSLALIIYGAQVYGVPATGPWFVKVMQVLFWMYLGSVTVVVVFQYHVIFEVEKLALSEAVPAWILPAYPFLVTGVLAAAISKKQPQESAVQMIIAGIMGQGLGWILALFIYVVYLTRLINHNMPPPPTRPGMYVSVGPAGK